jgi:hypothetical protein
VGEPWVPPPPKPLHNPLSYGTRGTIAEPVSLLDGHADICQSRNVKSCRPSGLQDLAFVALPNPHVGVPCSVARRSPWGESYVGCGRADARARLPR